MSRASASAKVLAAKVNDFTPDPVKVWLGIGLATVGVSLTLVSASWKVVGTVPPWPSSAGTCGLSGVASPAAGLPLKVRVAGVNVSHAGRAPPPASVAL